MSSMKHLAKTTSSQTTFLGCVFLLLSVAARQTATLQNQQPSLQGSEYVRVNLTPSRKLALNLRHSVQSCLDLA